MDSRIISATLSLMVPVPLNATLAFSCGLHLLPAFSLRGSLPLCCCFLLFFFFSFSVFEAEQHAEGVCGQTAPALLEAKQAPVNAPS